MNTQYKKGVLELCVLAMLSRQDCYGYEISEYLSERIGIADGTIYPILRKLKNDGMVSTYLSEESGGPPRKYYSLTKRGSESFGLDLKEYLGFADTVKLILTENEGVKNNDKK